MADSKTTTALSTGMSMTTKRKAAKVGMATSLGVLVATGLMETEKAPVTKRIHLWSGFALVGFSYWHYTLYNRQS